MLGGCKGNTPKIYYDMISYEYVINAKESQTKELFLDEIKDSLQFDIRCSKLYNNWPEFCDVLRKHSEILDDEGDFLVINNSDIDIIVSKIHSLDVEEQTAVDEFVHNLKENVYSTDDVIVVNIIH